ncbi:MAG TPA: SDR family NAD(P)-dependent oxidoreductase [Rhodanobacteraceae bacterium]
MSESAPATAIVIGASSGLGRALAKELARKQYALLLIASDRRDLDALAANLNLEHGIAVRALALDLGREADPGARIATTLDGMPPLSALLLVAGQSREDDDFSLDAAAIGQALAINLHAPLAIVHALLPRLVEAHGTIVLFGSVAAVRGRGRNVVYASAKRALVSLYESLRQRYRSRELCVQLYELGFMATNLTFGKRLPLPAADPAVVAETVVRRIGRGSSKRYVPRWWRFIAAAVQCLPWFVYRRLKD